MEPRMIFCLTRARVESQNHWFTYDEKMQVHCTFLQALELLWWVEVEYYSWSQLISWQVESVAQAVSNLAIQFGDSDDDAGVMSRCWNSTTLIEILLITFSLQTFRCCNSLCWNGRQWDPALPHGSQRHIPPVWRKGNWLRQRGSSTEFARGSNFWELYFLHSHLSNY